MDPLISSLENSDLPNEDLQFLSGVIGLEAVKKLMDACRGMSFYVPLKMPQDFCRRYILTHYRREENNVRPLAKSLGITEQHVYRLLRQKRRGTPAAARAA